MVRETWISVHFHYKLALPHMDCNYFKLLSNLAVTQRCAGCQDTTLQFRPEFSPCIYLVMYSGLLIKIYIKHFNRFSNLIYFPFLKHSIPWKNILAPVSFLYFLFQVQAEVDNSLLYKYWNGKSLFLLHVCFIISASIVPSVFQVLHLNK